MTPQEVQERLKLNQLKDKIWYVVPSCATTGEGLFEGLVSCAFSTDHPSITHLHTYIHTSDILSIYVLITSTHHRAGCRIMSRLPHNDRLDRR